VVQTDSLFARSELARVEPESRHGEITGAVIGAIAGAVLARGLSCSFAETGCRWEWKPLAFGVFVGGFIGAGIGSAADD
jgi:hypothetical protein